jgi:predicted dehydrogenase
VSRELRIGGRRGRRRGALAAYAQLPDVRIVGIATRTRERGEALAARFGADAVYADAEALLDGARPDGVSICTNDNQHVAPTLAALDRGVGVLLRSPSRGCDGRRDDRRGRPSDQRLFVPATSLRFALPYQRLNARSRRASGGRGVSARRDRTRWIHEHYAHVHPAFLTCVHDIDLALWVTGSRAVRVRSMGIAPRVMHSRYRAQAELAGRHRLVATAYLHPSDVPVPTSTGSRSTAPAWPRST